MNRTRREKEEGISIKMNPQKAAELAKFVDVFVNTNLSLKEILSKYKPGEVISQYKPEVVLSMYKTEDFLTSLDKTKLKHLKKQLNAIAL